MKQKTAKKSFDQLRRCQRQSSTGCEGVQIPMATLTHETAVLRARDIADRVLAPAAASNDKSGRFSTEAVTSLLATLGSLRADSTRWMWAVLAASGPRTFAAVTATLAEADASVAMVYL